MTARQGMTGFCRAEGQSADGWSWAWEARSVNGRGLDLKVRLPPGYEDLEPVVRETAQARFRRGSLQVGLALTRPSPQAGVQIDFSFIDSVLNAAAPYVARGLAAPPRFDGVLALRGALLQEDRAEQSPQARAALIDALRAGLETALDGLAAARLQDGAAVSSALERALDAMTQAIGEAHASAATQPVGLLERLKARLATLAPEVQIDPQRLAQEAALLAAKADVREELDRLDAHVGEARALLAGADPAGRRLEFLAQELNREANTLGAKAADLALTRLSIDLKTAIDQFREHAANVE